MKGFFIKLFMCTAEVSWNCIYFPLSLKCPESMNMQIYFLNTAVQVHWISTQNPVSCAFQEWKWMSFKTVQQPSERINKANFKWFLAVDTSASEKSSFSFSVLICPALTVGKVVCFNSEPLLRGCSHYLIQSISFKMLACLHYLD